MLSSCGLEAQAETKKSDIWIYKQLDLCFYMSINVQFFTSTLGQSISYTKHWIHSMTEIDFKKK